LGALVRPLPRPGADRGGTRKEYDGKIVVGKLNTDDNPNTASHYNISAIPTMLFFKGGQVVDQMVGVYSNKDIKAKLDDLLK
jgi:thioredoxin 1